LNALDENAKSCNACYNTLKLHPNTTAQKMQQFELYQFTLCGFSPSLEFRALLSKLLKMVTRGLLACLQTVECPMDRQIRISTNRRCKVTVTITGQRIVSLV
jgi:hypothetical protein